MKRRIVKRERAQFLVRVHAISDATRNALRRCRYLVPLPKITFSAKKREEKQPIEKKQEEKSPKIADLPRKRRPRDPVTQKTSKLSPGHKRAKH